MKAESQFRGYVAFVVLLLTTVSITQAKYGGGSGTPDHPYQISAAADLILLGKSPGDYGKHFILTADIDLDPNLPGGQVFHQAIIPTFAGVFYGNGHTISHLTIEGGGYLGLFGWLGYGAQVKDLGIVDVNIMGSGDRVGGLVGYNEGGTVTQCYSTGRVFGGGDGIGGLGGLVGVNESGTLTQCYSSGTVGGSRFSVGGLVGYNWDGTVTHCYSTGTVNGEMFSVGGLVGYNERGTVLHCVWDVQTSGRSRSSGGVGLTTAEMMDPHMLGLNGFGGDPNWVLDAGRDYPRLAWEGTPGKTIPEPDTAWLEGRGTAADPYRLGTPGQLIALSEAPFLWDKRFILIANIDLDPNLPGRKTFDEALIAPARSSPFFGVFDGKGHTISHLTIRGQSELGLFGRLESGAIVKDLGVVDVSVTGSGGDVGGLVGSNDGALSRCYSTGEASGAGWSVGGLVGSIEEGTVTQCYSTCAVSGRDGVGGLVGVTGQAGLRSSTVAHCYSTGEVSGDSHTGGLVGLNENCSVTQCYSTGAVNGGLHVGGLVALYDYGGWRGTVTMSFWDTRTSGQVWSDGGTGLTTAQMQRAQTFLDARWDFVGETNNGAEDIWWIDEGRDYPRLSWEQGQARMYCPSQGSADVVQPVLCWRPGGQGLLHDVYFGDNEAGVAGATPANPGIYCGRQLAEMVTYAPGNLVSGKTYYWRIDEVNQTDPGSVWKGEVWSFATADYTVLSVVDDFESYTDVRAGHFIFKTWEAGGNCPIVGYVFPPAEGPSYAEQVIVHTGRQSMPMEYFNDVEPWYSEAHRTWETPQDWTIDGADALTLFVRGEVDNTRDTLYVAIEDSAGQIAMVTHPDPNVVLTTRWQKWEVPLADLRAAGVDIAAVKKMVIGVGDRNSPKPGGGGTGKIYIDDIRLTKRMP